MPSAASRSSKRHVTPTLQEAITLLRLSIEEATMRTTIANRTERPANDQQTDLWSDALSKPTTREARHERVKRIADEAITRLAEALEQGRSEALTDYLGAMSRFHRYSLHNVLLIAAQRPDATHVAGFRKWAEMERHVVKGAKGIAILAPLIRKARGDTSSDEGGGEEAVEPGRVLGGFRVVYVFDVSDTDGKPLPGFARVTGDPGEHLQRLKGIATGKGIKLEYAKDLSGAYGTSSGGTIQLLEGQTPAEEFSVLAHELAHEMLHWRDREQAGDKRQRETQAEAVAFVVTSACGLDTGTAASDYIQLYRGNRDTLAASLEGIQKTASEILATLLPE
jgi:hypothetical protein